MLGARSIGCDGTVVVAGHRGLVRSGVVPRLAGVGFRSIVPARRELLVVQVAQPGCASCTEPRTPRRRPLGVPPSPANRARWTAHLPAAHAPGSMRRWTDVGAAPPRPLRSGDGHRPRASAGRGVRAADARCHEQDLVDSMEGQRSTGTSTAARETSNRAQTHASIRRPSIRRDRHLPRRHRRCSPPTCSSCDLDRAR